MFLFKKKKLVSSHLLWEGPYFGERVLGPSCYPRQRPSFSLRIPRGWPPTPPICFLFCFCLLNILPECFYSVFPMVVSLGYPAADIFVKLMSQQKNQWQTRIWLHRGGRHNLGLIVCKYSSLAAGLSDSLAEREEQPRLFSVTTLAHAPDKIERAFYEMLIGLNKKRIISFSGTSLSEWSKMPALLH